MGWLDALPDDVVRRSAVLSVFRGWMLMVAGDLDAVADRLDDAERALAGGRDAGRRQRGAAHPAGNRGHLPRLARSSPRRHIEHGAPRPACARPGRSGRPLLAGCCVWLPWAHSLGRWRHRASPADVLRGRAEPAHGREPCRRVERHHRPGGHVARRRTSSSCAGARCRGVARGNGPRWRSGRASVVADGRAACGAWRAGLRAGKPRRRDGATWRLPRLSGSGR